MQQKDLNQVIELFKKNDPGKVLGLNFKKKRNQEI